MVTDRAAMKERELRQLGVLIRTAHEALRTGAGRQDRRRRARDLAISNSPKERPATRVAGLCLARGRRRYSAALTSVICGVAKPPRLRWSRPAAIERIRFMTAPVPAGIRRPTITFSFNPIRLSVLPAVAASVSTRVVSWNEAALMKLE